MKKINIGFQKEDMIIKNFNNKKFNQLPRNFQNIAERVFNKIHKFRRFHCERVMGYKKPDILLRHGREKVYISIKTGNARTVHQENIRKFIPYLRSLGIKEETLKTIVLFHYGDGTLDGKGKRRLSYIELMPILHERIKRANQDLNSSYEVIQKVFHRCVIQGTFDDSPEADFIYHGEKEFGYIVSKSQLKKYINKKDWQKLDNLHIGPLLFSPHARYTRMDKADESKRELVDFRWPNIYGDLAYIDHHFSD